MQQLIQLRWIAVGGQVVTIAAAHFGLGIESPLGPMSATLAFLVAFNLASLLRLRSRRELTNLEVFVALLVDVGTLTVQFHLSGGATNLFASLYLLQVILGAMLLGTGFTWAMLAVAAACFAGLTLEHRALPLALDYERGLASLYIQGLLLCFALNAVLLVIFTTRIGRNLRARDARLADLRRRAAEEEHIVRMGLLASGAAHELGTPLATLAVILGDWRRMPSADPERLQELDEMQTQVQRCKAILSGILLSAGEARGEASVETTVGTFLEDLVSHWRARRSTTVLNYVNRFGEDLPIVSDSALKQMICNVLDNALEASPHSVTLEVAREGDVLTLVVSDEGPGFGAEILAQFGKPYQSTKGRPGGGLGLFLAVNVARTLGGSVTARNRAAGGAVVTLTLPLSAITLERPAT